MLGDAYDELYSAPAQVCRGVSINALRCSVEMFLQLAPFSTALSPFCSESRVLTDPATKPGAHAYHHAGVYYVQEPSAASVAALCGIHPGDKVLDVCAAPGGKTSQLAAYLGGEGLLVANEFIALRASVLKSNLERMGVQNAVILNDDTARIAAALPAFFDCVLVDAPCSGEGMFRKEPEALRQHSEALVRQCAALGNIILENAAACLAPGGTLIYSTCTFAPQEDEMQIGAFLAAHADFELVPIDVSFGSAGEIARCGDYDYPVKGTRRIYPCHGGEGHFMAKLHRKGNKIDIANSPNISRPKASKKMAKPQKQTPAECTEFLKTYFPMLQERKTLLHGEAIFILPKEPLPDLSKVHVLRVGVEAGSVIKGRFEPAHALFMAYGAQCTNCERLTAGDARVGAWLHGEQVEAQTAAQGYAAVLVDGFPIGGGKQSGGVLKNRYPKGLRTLY